MRASRLCSFAGGKAADFPFSGRAALGFPALAAPGFILYPYNHRLS